MEAAVVVGASSEIGRAIAEYFASRGLALHLWGRDRDRLAQTGIACEAAGAGAISETVVDLEDAEQLRAAVAGVVESGQSIVGLVWAAGQFQWGRFDTVDPAGAESVLTTTFTAAVTTTQLLLPSLIAAAPSTVVFVGSGAGRQAYADNAAYVAAKHGIRGFAEALHLDVCDEGVTVGIVSAGLVTAGAGQFAPAARERPDAMLRPIDIARAVQFIAESPANVCPTEIVLRPATRHL
ncbi:SDR family oxidoreductase [Agrococcus jenensis]|uniref:NADP-dependent 3-hydroxy acid dehydrogenase YdfG n=1 Tax=Agrococcus jenensis TaxID=46353 RepID=A0A3N2AUJ3_9MICO|nr:SDR family NAD(P)-dependent oxidoreductase [Agrococcus jenensis]ROR66709.1 NADP-dependent 3-hydroxy acid dehydrogenase YdfG [Agrococcus jenensis]